MGKGSMQTILELMIIQNERKQGSFIVGREKQFRIWGGWWRLVSGKEEKLEKKKIKTSFSSSEKGALHNTLWWTLFCYQSWLA